MRAFASVRRQLALCLDGVGVAPLDRACRFADLAPATLPVCRWFSTALAEARPHGLRNALAAVAPQLCWRQNPTYGGAPFLDRYGYCELAGPGGHWTTTATAVGVLLLGPDTDYPEHAHPARETYLVLGGAAQWTVGGEPWHLRCGGDVIRHGSGVPHAMRTGAEPLLALYVWADHLYEPARLVAEETHDRHGPVHADR